MSERDTFGPRLRSERERRGISLETIASVTNVGIELWQGLERNDFSRWPSGIFARAFVRDYARAIGLDGDELVDEFCRLFPTGDRRASRVIRAQAELIGHTPEYHDDSTLIPGGVDRRGAAVAAEQRQLRRLRIVPRTLAVTLDTLGICTGAALVALVTPMSFWPSLGVTALVYVGAGTLTAGTTFGMRAADILQQRVPALFAFQNRRAHA